MQPLDVIQAIASKTGNIGASFYFVPETMDRGKELGLDGFRFYVVGRGGVLGAVDSGVVRSAFGYFHPDLVAKLWDTGIERIAPRECAREYIACAHAVGRATFTGLDDLGPYVDAATTVIAAAEGAALALFAGLRAEPLPADEPAAAMHQAMVLRELRGSAHLAAVAAVGLRSEVAHAIKRPNDVELFGWKGDETPRPSDIDRAALDRAEAITDAILVPAFSTLSGDQAVALVAGTDAMHAALTSG